MSADEMNLKLRQLHCSKNQAIAGQRSVIIPRNENLEQKMHKQTNKTDLGEGVFFIGCGEERNSKPLKSKSFCHTTVDTGHWTLDGHPCITFVVDTCTAVQLEDIYSWRFVFGSK